jgi:agglutinin receptor
MKSGGAAGVVLGLAAVGLAMGTSTVSANEKVVDANQPKVQETGIEVKESAIKNETPTGNASTNLNAPAGAISDKQKSDLSNENKVTGETPVTIDHTKVQEEAKNAEQVGVNVVQDKTQVAPTTSTAEDTAKAVKSITAKETEKSNELKSTATAHSTAVSNWVDQKNSTVAFNNELDKDHLKAVESYNDFIKTLDADTASVVAQHKDAIIKVTEIIQKASDGTSVEGYQAYIRSLAEQQGINKEAIKDYLVKKAEYNSKSTANSETVVRNLSNSTRIDAENKAKSQSVDAENTRRSTSAQKVVEDNTAKSNSTVAENNRLSTSAKTENERLSNSAKAVENDNNAKSLSAKAENEKRSNSAKAENERRSNSAEKVKEDNLAKSNSVVAENNKRSNSAKTENERRSNSAKDVENDNVAKSNSVVAENNRRSLSAKTENEKRSNAVKKVENDNVAKSNSVVEENKKRSLSADAETVKRSQSADAENAKRSNSAKAENEKRSLAAQQGITNEREKSLAVAKENERRSNSAKAETARRSSSAKAENEKRSNAVKKVEEDNRTKSLSVVAENNKRSNSAKAETVRRATSAAAENSRRSNSVKAENDKLLANYNSSMATYRTAKEKYDKEKSEYDRKLVEYNSQKLQGQSTEVKVVGEFDESKRGSLDYYSKLTAIFSEDKDLEVMDGALGVNANTTMSLDKDLQHDRLENKDFYRYSDSKGIYGGYVITGIKQGSTFTLHNVGKTKTGKTISAKFVSRNTPVKEHNLEGSPSTNTRLNVWWEKVTNDTDVKSVNFNPYNYLNVEWDITFFDESTNNPLKLGVINLYSDLDYNQGVRYTYENGQVGVVINPAGSLVEEVTVRGEKFWAGKKVDGVHDSDDPAGLNRWKQGDPWYANVNDYNEIPAGSIISVGKGTTHHLSYLANVDRSLSPYSEEQSASYRKYWNDERRANGKQDDNDDEIFASGYAFQLWGGKSVVNQLIPPTPPVEPKQPKLKELPSDQVTYEPATYTPVEFKPTTPPPYTPVTYTPATYDELPYKPGTPIPYVPVGYEKVTYEKATYKPVDFKPDTPPKYVPVTYEKVTYTPGNTDWKPVSYEKVTYKPGNTDWEPVSYEKVPFTPADTSWKPVGYTPLKFTPKNTDWNPVPYVPTPYVPEKLPEVPKEPVLEMAKLTAPTDPVFHKIPKEPKVPTVHYHLTALNENTPVEKLAQNEDGVNINNESVAKNSTNHFILKPKALPAGRPITTSIVLSDYMADGIELDIAGMQKANKSWDISYNTKTRLLEVKGVSTEYDKANADRTVPYTPTAFTIIYKVLNDGATYENVFKMDINGGAKGGNHTGYTSYSNKVRIHTPGSPTNPNDPKNPNGGGNHKIQPVKNNTNKEGQNINNKTLLQTDVNYYVAEWDLDQYINDKSSKSAIAKGFGYLENYPEKAVTPITKDYYAVTSKGEKVEGLDFYEADSAKLNELPEHVQQFIKDSGIDVSNFGKFQVWIAKDSQAFYDKYVKTGQDVFFHAPMAVNKGFTGKYENQTFQIDFGNGYYGNVVHNNVPNLTPKKDVVVDGKSANGGTITYGQEFSYLLSGAKLPGNRGSHVWEYRYIDDYDQTGDKYLGKYKVVATTDITVSQLEEVKEDTTFKEDVTLEDGTVVKAGQKVSKGLKVRRTHVIKTGEDVTKFTEANHDEANGIITISFKEDFLKTVVDSSEFGADASIDMKRVAYGEFYNKYTNRVNGVDYISNTVKTTTPKPPTPEQPKQPELPYTGTSESSASMVGMAILSVLGLAGLARRRNQ